MVGTLEPKRLKVAALNLLHPTASPLSERLYFHFVTRPPKGDGDFFGLRLFYYGLLNNTNYNVLFLIIA